MRVGFFIICFLILLLSNKFIAQNEAGIVNQEKNKKTFKIAEWSDPKKASVMSAILPGAGQVFNKKYWKVPVIYGIGGFLVFNGIQQNARYLLYKKELLNVLNGGVSQDGYSAEQLTLLKNQSKKWRDLSVAGVVLVYVLNILDANIDAHLKTFDVGNDLSFKVQVQYTPDFFLTSYFLHTYQYGLSLSLKF